MSAKGTTTEQVLTLKWIVTEDKLVKFDELPEPYEISAKVAEFDFERAGIVKGTKVNVKIEKSDATPEGLVVFMTKVKGQATSEAPKTEAPKATEAPKSASQPTAVSPDASKSPTKELTIKAVAKANRGILFDETGDQTWFTLGQDIDPNGLYDKGYKKGSKVSVTLAPPVGRSKNEIVVKMDLLEAPAKPKWTGKKNFKSDYDSPERQRSIESQAAVNAANRVVSSMVTPTTDADTVLKMIRRIAEANLALIDELKSK